MANFWEKQETADLSRESDLNKITNKMIGKSFMEKKYPMKMRPFFKDYLWGGTRLKDEYNKKTDLTIVAESWEVSCHPDGPCVVDNGEFKGQTLDFVLNQHPGWMGSLCSGFTEFPLLIKLIDSRELLSLQVHPDDEYARAVDNQAGKNEMWYVAAAKPGAELILGFNEPLNKNEVRAAIAKNELMQAVRRIPVSAGDCYRVPAGLLHAVCDGIIIVEVQQNSNLTYRVYDYDRKDINGNKRELHVDKAVDVLDTTLNAEKSSGNYLADWKYFKSELVTVKRDTELNCNDESFQCLVTIEGELTITNKDSENPNNFDDQNLKKGETVFIPAGMGNYTLNGQAKVMLVSMV